jgi:integrase
MARTAKGRLFTRGKNKNYHVQFYINGKEIKRVLYDEDGKNITNKKIAQKAMDKLLAPYIAQDEIQRREQAVNALKTAKEKAKELEQKQHVIKLDDVWQEYMKNPSRPDSSKGTLGNYERHWNNFMEWLKGSHTSKTLLPEIDENITREYSHYLWSVQKRKISAGTFNYHIKSLTLITRVLMYKSGLINNPWQSITHKSEIKQQRKEFTNAQIQSIFDSFADQDLKIILKKEYEVLFHIAAFTGLRLIDAVNLKWDFINFNRNIISLIPQKTIKVQRHVNIPIHPNLKEKLVTAYEWKDETNKVLPKISARYAANATGVKKDCIKILEFCGLKDRGEGRGHNRRLYGFHSFRHFFASTCADAGVPVATLAEILGDNISTLNKYYIHAQEESRQRMISALNNGVGNKDHIPLPSPEPERQQLIELAKEMPIEIVRTILLQMKKK